MQLVIEAFPDSETLSRANLPRGEIGTNAYYIDEDFIAEGTLLVWNNDRFCNESIECQGLLYTFVTRACQFRGQVCESFSCSLSNLDHVYMMTRYSEPMVFIRDYFNDEEKPEHMGSMEKELSKQDRNRFRVRYKGAAGNRAYFERHIITNGCDDKEESAWVDCTAEVAISSLLPDCCRVMVD